MSDFNHNRRLAVKSDDQFQLPALGGRKARQRQRLLRSLTPQQRVIYNEIHRTNERRV